MLINWRKGKCIVIVGVGFGGVFVVLELIV